MENRERTLPPPRSVTAFPPVRTIGRKWAPHEDLYHSVLTRSWWEFVAIVAGAFVVANALFGLLYLVQPGSISNAREGSFEDAFFFSVQTMATIGYGGMAPATLYGHLLVTSEAIIAMLGVAVVTGVTFSKFARPTARVLFAERSCSVRATEFRTSCSGWRTGGATPFSRRSFTSSFCSRRFRAKGTSCEGPSTYRWCAIETRSSS